MDKNVYILGIFLRGFMNVSRKSILDEGNELNNVVSGSLSDPSAF